MTVLRNIVAVAAAAGAASAFQLVKDVPEEPMAGEDPTFLLCALGGKEAKIAPWCKSWVSCIKDCSNPVGTKEKVRSCWDPAPCEEYCGKFPRTTPSGFLQKHDDMEKADMISKSKLTAMMGVGASSHDACMNSCSNFQNSLSNCVAQIIHEPGKIAVMKEKCTGKKVVIATKNAKDEIRTGETGRLLRAR